MGWAVGAQSISPSLPSHLTSFSVAESVFITSRATVQENVHAIRDLLTEVFHGPFRSAVVAVGTPASASNLLEIGCGSPSVLSGRFSASIS